jgi:NAD(P)-dependent dehydrogenase (short-subunit alcohol dehydrogenase family)
MHVKDRTFIVTGGASGLGLATAEDLHENGAYVAILDVNPENGNKIVEQLGNHR